MAFSYIWLCLFHAPLNQNATFELKLHTPEHDFFTALPINTLVSCSYLLSLAILFYHAPLDQNATFELKLHAQEHDFSCRYLASLIMTFSCASQSEAAFELIQSMTFSHPYQWTHYFLAAVSYLSQWLFHASLNQNGTLSSSSMLWNMTFSHPYQ